MVLYKHIFFLNLDPEARLFSASQSSIGETQGVKMKKKKTNFPCDRSIADVQLRAAFKTVKVYETNLYEEISLTNKKWVQETFNLYKTAKLYTHFLKFPTIL